MIRPASVCHCMKEGIHCFSPASITRLVYCIHNYNYNVCMHQRICTQVNGGSMLISYPKMRGYWSENIFLIPFTVLHISLLNENGLFCRKGEKQEAFWCMRDNGQDCVQSLLLQYLSLSRYVSHVTLFVMLHKISHGCLETCFPDSWCKYFSNVTELCTGLSLKYLLEKRCRETRKHAINIQILRMEKQEQCVVEVEFFSSWILSILL